MTVPINEPISVILISDCETRKVRPYKIKWKGREYKVEQIAMPYRLNVAGKKRHVFTVYDGATTFQISLDPETLLWTLDKVAGEDG